MTPMFPDNSRQSGFTLMELMVVLVLIAVISAVTIPAMKGTYEDAILKSVSRDLVGAFQIATSRAITGRQIHRIRFDRRTGRYHLEKAAGKGRGEDTYTPAPDIPGGDGTIDSRVSIEFRKPGDDRQDGHDPDAAPSPVDAFAPAGLDEAILFYPDGTADACEIQLEDRDGFRLGLRINPVTARVRIIEFQRK